MNKNSSDNSVLLYIAANNFSEAGYRIAASALQRAGFAFFLASEAGTICTGSAGLKVKNDILINNVRPANFCAVIFLGGTGIAVSANDANVIGAVKKFRGFQGIIAAICYAPLLLAKAGMLQNADATCHPNVRGEASSLGAVLKDVPVIRHGNIITGRDESAGSEFINLVISSVRARAGR